MKRWLLLILMILFSVLAAAFSLVNRDSVQLDLLAARTELPLGVLVLAALLVGAAIAGAVLFSTVVLSQNLKLRALRRELDKLKSQQPKSPLAEPPAPTAPIV